MIFNDRAMDYYIYPTVAESNAKAAELIISDEYDFIAIYNKNYDSVMHKNGPEGIPALAELRTNAEAFAVFSHLIAKRWGNHDTLVGFAMDHGCHAKKDGGGTHGKDVPQDRNIRHFYQIYPKQA